MDNVEEKGAKKMCWRNPGKDRRESRIFSVMLLMMIKAWHLNLMMQELLLFHKQSTAASSNISLPYQLLST
jgi:hypothetical protein